MTCTPRNPCHRVTGPEWSEDQCRWCWRKRYPFDAAEQVERERAWQSQAREQLACQHRAEQLGQLAVTCCGGRPAMIPFFACDLHGRCIYWGTNDQMQIDFVQAVKSGKPPELWQCNLCRDRPPPATG